MLVPLTEGLAIRILAHVSRGALAAALLTVGALIGAALTLGATSNAAPIHACVARTGSTRLLTSGKCRRGETAVAWNQGGRAGPRGPAGAAGNTGAAGPSGLAGAAGAAGAPGQNGAKGDRGTFQFDSFEGMPCTKNNVAGTTHVAFGASGQVGFTCS
jgi:hypothetical protein